MTGTAATALAVACGLAAAAAFGTGVALQHRQAQLAPVRRGAPFRLLAQLARRRLWLAGIALSAAAYGLQGLALAFGPLALVAPVTAMDLLFALPLAARWARLPMRARDWAGCVLAGGGVAVFLAVAPPSSGRSDAPAQSWLAAFAAVAVLAGVAVSTAVLTRGTARAAALAVAAGTVFGLTGAVTLSVARLARQQGLAVVAGHWQPWAVLVLGASGLLLSMTAFQAGALAVSLPVIDCVEPVAAVLIGAAIFGERLAASPAGLAGQLAAAAAAAAGIILLGRSTAAVQAHSQPARGQRRPASGTGRGAVRSPAAEPGAQAR